MYKGHFLTETLIWNLLQLTNFITIPESGTIKTSNPPVVVIASNRTREVHDALKRCCLYFGLIILRLKRNCAKTTSALVALDQKALDPVIADISGPMERYTRLLLHFIYEMKVALSQPVEAFVISI